MHIGRAATSADIALLAGLNSVQVSVLLRNYSKKHGYIGMSYGVGHGGGGKVAFFYFRSWTKRQREPRKLLFRPFGDPMEARWHRRKIPEYGCEAWAELVNRDPLDLLLKLRMTEGA